MQTLIGSVNHITQKLEKFETKLESISAIQLQVATISKDVNSLKHTVNFIDQESRSKTIRIIGLKVPEIDITQYGQEKAIIKKAYEKLVKPILNAAKNKGELETVPILLNVLEQGRFVSKGFVDQQGRTLPPIVSISFNKWYIRNVVMRYKKDNMPTPTDSDKASGISFFSLVEDLTPTNAKRLKEFRDNDNVDRAWTVDGKVRFVLKSSSETARKAPSSDLSAAEVIAKIK